MKRTASKAGRTARRIGSGTLLVALTLLMGADPLERGNRDASRRRIAAMSQSERERLERNFDAYRRLKEHSPEQLNNYRKLHHEVVHQPELQTTMTSYHSWLKTLSLWQQDELRKEKDPHLRVELVRRFLADQEQRQNERNKPFSDEYYRRFARPPWSGPPLSGNDLNAVMQVVEQHVNLSPQEKEEVQAKSGIRRHVAVMKKVFGGPGPSEPPGPNGRFGWLKGNVVRQMIQAISNEKTREEVERLSHEDQMRGRLIGLIIRGLFRELTDELQRHLPTEEEQVEYWNSLSGKERDRIMNSPGDQKRTLIQHYLTKKNTELADVMSFMRRMPGRGRPPGSRFGNKGRNRDGSSRGGFRGDRPEFERSRNQKRFSRDGEKRKGFDSSSKPDE